MSSPFFFFFFRNVLNVDCDLARCFLLFGPTPGTNPFSGFSPRGQNWVIFFDLHVNLRSSPSTDPSPPFIHRRLKMTHLISLRHSLRSLIGHLFFARARNWCPPFFPPSPAVLQACTNSWATPPHLFFRVLFNFCTPELCASPSP